MKRILLIPTRITAMLINNHGKVLKIILMILVLITALYTKEYRGEYQAIINNNIGGILYVLFGGLLFSATFPRLSSWQAVIPSLAITCLLEFIQYLRLPFMVELTKVKTFAYLFGVSYNPVDFIYYFAGAIIAWALLWMIADNE